MNVIVKSIILGIILFVIANTYLLVGNPPIPDYYPSPKAINRVILDRAFIDYEYKNKIVLVGSSLTSKLGNCQDPRFVNIGLMGRGNLDGLTILSKISAKPKVVFVEVNFNARELNEDVVNYNVPFKSWLYRYFPIFRMEKNLISILVSNAFSQNSRSKASTTTRPAKNYDELVNEYVISSRIMGTEQKNVEKLYKLAKELKQNGVQVVLVYYPVDHRIQNTAAYQENIRLVENKMSEFEYVSVQDKNYKTTDGVHLTQEDAQRFCEEVLKK
jgi:hypothetical protein